MDNNNTWFIFVILFLAGGLTECNSARDAPDKYFLNEIFTKYGDGGEINFEGFEHLLDNLGLGGRVFQQPHELSLHKINGTFSQFHDAAHRHKRHGDIQLVDSNIKNCLSPHDMLKIYGLENQQRMTIDPNTFLHLCPAIVYQLDLRLCFEMEPYQKDSADSYIAWLYTGLCILIISATGLLGVAIMPVIHSIFFDHILHFLVAIAIGTLCGDALMHLLPHALVEDSGHSHNHNDPIFKCTVTLVAVLVFYSVETLMAMFRGDHGSHGHTHGHYSNKEEVAVFEIDEMLPSPKKKKGKPLTPVALMVILGDTLHNLTDGLAIGAAFSTDLVTGFATALAVFCHELPHELGDFAVLLRSGMTIKKAICCNILSSIISFFGAAIGLWLGEGHKSSSQWIYAATAGTFLYIALVDLVPEINNGKKTFSIFLLSVLGIVLGYMLMLSIALYEDSLVSLLQG